MSTVNLDAGNSGTAVHIFRKFDTEFTKTYPQIPLLVELGNNNQHFT